MLLRLTILVLKWEFYDVENNWNIHWRYLLIDGGGQRDGTVWDEGKYKKVNVLSSEVIYWEGDPWEGLTGNEDRVWSYP